MTRLFLLWAAPYTSTEVSITVLQILYRDDHVVVVHKPSGMLVHRSRLDKGARRFVVQEVRNQVGQHVYPVHRLDKPTSGVLLLALSSDAARVLGQAFTERRVMKTYLAIVRGHPDAEGLVDHSLNKVHDPGSALRPARTRYRRLATAELPFAVSRYPTSRYALVRVQPETGRPHQIRRHLNHIAHPIIGDGKHGDYRHNRFFREHFACYRLLLAATELIFPHPETEAPITVSASPDASFQRIMDALGWDSDA